MQKTILVTGGAGSVGSALIARLKESCVSPIVVDHDDYALWSLSQRYKIIPILADVREKNIELIDAIEQSHTIVHCAAYKNLAITENFVEQTVSNDFNGTTNMLELIRLSKMEENTRKRFLLLSSDKAVAPISVMGAAKMLAEKATLNATSNNLSASVLRFVNVIETRGNVFEKWRNEKERGEDFSITDTKMLRYFVHLDYIVDFILHTTEIMRGGEIFIPDHGKLTPILTKLYELYGRDAKYKLIGIRKNEKLKDELYTPEERKGLETLKMSNNRILYKIQHIWR